jgi:hypothetical protein
MTLGKIRNILLLLEATDLVKVRTKTHKKYSPFNSNMHCYLC